MATEDTSLILSISADLAQLQRALKRMETDTNRSTRAVEKQFAEMGKNAERAVRASTGRIQSMLAGLKDAGTGLASGLAAGLTVQAFTRFADSGTRVTNALRVAGLEGKNLSDTYERLGKIALANGASFESVANLYAKVSQNAKTLGINSRQAEEFTRRIAVGLRASGTDAQAASAGILQLNQALASGVLRGDEFNSVAENLPVVAKAIADGLGVTVGRLREMASEGELDAKTVFDAFIKGSEGLDAQAAKTSATFSQAFENITTALTIAIGEFNSATGASKGFSEAITTVVAPAIVSLGEVVAYNNQKIQEFSDWLGRVTGLRAVGDEIRELAGELGNSTNPLIQAMQAAEDQSRQLRAALSADLSAISSDYDKAMASLQATGQGEVASGIASEFERLAQKVREGTFTVEDFDTVITKLADTGNVAADKLAGRLELIQAKFAEASAAAQKSFEEAGRALVEAFGTNAISVINTLIDKIGNALPASVSRFGASLREAARLAAMPEGDRPTVPLPAEVSVTPERRVDPYFDGQSSSRSDNRLATEAKRAADKLNDAIARQTATAVDAVTQYIGQNENANRGSINAFLKAGGVDLDAATSAWCAGFVNSALAQVGIKGTGSNVATDFLNFGKAVNLSDLQRGDILVDPNGRGAGQTGGHVGFATGQIRATAEGIAQVEILSGNASDQVSKDWIDASQVVARRATDAFQLPANALDNLTAKSAEAKAATDAQTAALKAQDQAYENLGQIASTALNGIATALADGKIEGEEVLQIITQIITQLLSMPRVPGAGGGGGLFGGLLGGGGSGGAGGLLGGLIIPGILHKGGTAGVDGYNHNRFAMPADFAGARRYHGGGIAGKRPGEIPAFLNPGELVIPKGGFGRGREAGAQPVSINVNVSGANGDDHVVKLVKQGVQQGIKQYDKDINRSFGARMANAQARQL
ncbi:tape measure protein [Mesorhizobium yinganensis]|uniref:tape measure protein n=1 Tax=Mesorhizobium yinganensis TaxID=3157707 RepID=UPI0032B80DB4